MKARRLTIAIWAPHVRQSRECADLQGGVTTDQLAEAEAVAGVEPPAPEAEYSADKLEWLFEEFALDCRRPCCGSRGTGSFYGP